MVELKLADAKVMMAHAGVNNSVLQDLLDSSPELNPTTFALAVVEQNETFMQKIARSKNEEIKREDELKEHVTDSWVYTEDKREKLTGTGEKMRADFRLTEMVRYDLLHHFKILSNELLEIVTNFASENLGKVRFQWDAIFTAHMILNYADRLEISYVVPGETISDFKRVFPELDVSAVENNFIEPDYHFEKETVTPEMEAARLEVKKVIWEARRQFRVDPNVWKLRDKEWQPSSEVLQALYDKGLTKKFIFGIGLFDQFQSFYHFHWLGGSDLNREFYIWMMDKYRRTMRIKHQNKRKMEQ